MEAEIPSSTSSPFCQVMLATATLAFPEVRAAASVSTVAVVYFMAPVAPRSANDPPDTRHCSLKVSAGGSRASLPIATQ